MCEFCRDDGERREFIDAEFTVAIAVGAVKYGVGVSCGLALRQPRNGVAIIGRARLDARE